MEIRKRRSSPKTVFEICHRPSFRVCMRWLKDKNAYGAAIANVFMLNPGYQWDCGKRNNIRGYISCMFTWVETSQGYNFWSELNGQWWAFARNGLHGYFNSLRDKKKNIYHDRI